MSLTELKEKADALPADERVRLLEHLSVMVKDEDIQATVDRRMKDMDAGRNVVSQAEVERIHRELGDD